MTRASCQSLWPVWEPATAVQSFTCWTMVREGTCLTDLSLFTDICLWFLLYCSRATREGDGVVGLFLDGWLVWCRTLHANSASTLWATQLEAHSYLTELNKRNIKSVNVIKVPWASLFAHVSWGPDLRSRCKMINKLNTALQSFPVLPQLLFKSLNAERNSCRMYPSYEMINHSGGHRCKEHSCPWCCTDNFLWMVSN